MWLRTAIATPADMCRWSSFSRSATVGAMCIVHPLLRNALGDCWDLWLLELRFGQHCDGMVVGHLNEEISRCTPAQAIEDEEWAPPWAAVHYPHCLGAGATGSAISFQSLDGLILGDRRLLCMLILDSGRWPGFK